MEQQALNIFPTPDIQLWQGDCLDLMPDIADESIDMVCSDPPYQITACHWDSIIPLELMWEQLKRVIKPNGAIVLTASQPFTTALISSNMKMFKYCWYWQKERVTNPLQCKRRAGKVVEECVVFYNNQPTYNPIRTLHLGKKVSNKPAGTHTKTSALNELKVTPYIDDGTRYPVQVIKFNRDLNKLHPTQKPVALMEYLIKTYTNEGETVLDFCMGSGTTLVACRNLNRNGIGIEKDLQYFKIAKERIHKENLD